MCVTAYIFEDDDEIEVGRPNFSGSYTCWSCEREFASVDEMHIERVVSDAEGNCLLGLNGACVNCASDFEINFIPDAGSNLRLLALQWLNTAAGQRILWKKENFENIPTSWHCVLTDVPKQWTPSSDPVAQQADTPTLAFTIDELAYFAFAIVSDHVEDSAISSQEDLSWCYFEDWLDRERGQKLTDLLKKQS